MKIYLQFAMKKHLDLFLFLPILIFILSCREEVTPPAEVKVNRKVFVLGNEAANNTIYSFNWTENGDLSTSKAFSTGGAGTGNPLRSHGSLVTTPDGKFLLAVNAGSSSISVFSISGDELVLTDNQAVSGANPVSITTGNGLVYVLHTGGNGGLTGFSLGSLGKLSVINGAQVSFGSAGLNPIQVAFSGDFKGLMVTNRDSASISYYSLNTDGTIAGNSSFTTAGAAPCGISPSSSNSFLVAQQRADSVGVLHLEIGTSGISQVGSSFYRQTGISGAVPAILSVPNGKFHYLLNDFNSSISLYTINPANRQPFLFKQVAAVTPPQPVGIACSKDSRFLFVLSEAYRNISGYAIDPNSGFLDSKRPIGSLPASATGIAVFVE